MGTNTVRDFLCRSLVVVTSIGYAWTHSGELPRVEILVEHVERVSREEVDVQLKVTNRSSKPVFLTGVDWRKVTNRGRPVFEGGIDDELGRRIEPVYLEQWRNNEGWKIVGPCMDTPPPHVLTLNPGKVMAFDSILALPLPSICKERNIQLEGKFRFRVEYFESEKQARAYIGKLFSARWKQAHAAAAVSEPFEIPPAPSP